MQFRSQRWVGLAMSQTPRKVSSIHPTRSKVQRSQCRDGLTVYGDDDVFATSNPLQQSPSVISKFTGGNFRHAQL
jgi:hypothetical protein